MSVRSSCSPQQELQAAYVVRTCLIWSDRDGDQVCFRMLCGVVQVVCVCVRPESRAPSGGCIVRARCVLVVARQGLSVCVWCRCSRTRAALLRRVRHVHVCASAIARCGGACGPPFVVCVRVPRAPPTLSHVACIVTKSQLCHVHAPEAWQPDYTARGTRMYLQMRDGWQQRPSFSR
jgi:hypothetical protein